MYSPDDDALVSLSPLHEVVGIVCDGKDVWRLLAQLSVLILLDVGCIVDWQELVGIDGHQD